MTSRHRERRLAVRGGARADQIARAGREHRSGAASGDGVTQKTTPAPRARRIPGGGPPGSTLASLACARGHALSCRSIWRGDRSPASRSAQPREGARCTQSDAAARTARSSASRSDGWLESRTTSGEALAPATSRCSSISRLRATVGQWMREAGLPSPVGAQSVELEVDRPGIDARPRPGPRGRRGGRPRARLPIRPARSRARYAAGRARSRRTHPEARRCAGAGDR